MSDSPLLEVLSTGAAPAGFSDLVLSLERWCRPTAGAPWRHSSPPVATLASSPRAEGLDAALEAGRAVAVWISRGEAESERTSFERAAALVSDGSCEFDGAPLDRLVRVPVPGIELDDWPATMPHVRARRRGADGHPDPMILDATPAGTASARADLATELALASVAAVDMRWAIPALALATPTVTDLQTAQRLGALDGVHVVIAERGDQLDAARDLSVDEHRVARLAREGRQLVERRHDRGAAAMKVARLLGLYRQPHGPRALLAARICELEVGLQ